MKNPVRLLCACLALLFLLSPVLTVAAAMPRSSGDGTSLDYLNPDFLYSHQTAIAPATLLGLLTSSSPSTAESEYVTNYFGESLRYSDTIPADCITVSREGNTVTVTAQPYTYTANNGKTVTFLPVSVALGSRNLTPTLTSGSYVAVFENVTDEESATVYYDGSLPVSPAAANKLLQFAYSAAVEGMGAASAIAAYDLAYANHRAYLTALDQYRADSEEYEDYLEAKAAYDLLYADYVQNQQEWANYDQAVIAYNQYQADYAAYTQALNEYRTEYLAYEAANRQHTAYVNNMAKLNTAMSAIDSIFIKPENMGSLYIALQNDNLIAMFEKYQDGLATVSGVTKKEIQELRACSDRLLDLLDGYASAKKASQKDAFTYYKTNYTEICDKFNYLYTQMTRIMNPTIYLFMRGKLQSEYPEDNGAYKTWRIKNVLAHIYLICLCLDDSQTAAGTWQFYDDNGESFTYYFSNNLLDPIVIITDTNASNPQNLSWMDDVTVPSVPTRPSAPTVVDEPVKPAIMTAPDSPTPVPEPTAPNEVPEPTAPAAAVYTLEAQTRGIRAAVEEELLTERTLVSEDKTISLDRVHLSKQVPAAVNPSEPDTDPIPEGTAYYLTAEQIWTTASFSSLDDLPVSLASYRDAEFTYSFAGWTVDRLQEIPPTTMTDGISVYAVYTKEKRTYTVTFLSEGSTFDTGTCHYGEIPVFPQGTPQKASDGKFEYTFSAWERTAENTGAGTYTYTALFTAKERSYAVQFHVGEKTYTQYYSYETTHSAPVRPTSYRDGVIFYEFTGWSSPMSSVKNGVTEYTAQYQSIPLASIPEGELTLTETASSYRVETDSSRVGFSSLMTLARQNSKTITLEFHSQGITLILDDTLLRAAERKQVASVVLVPSESASVSFSFLFLDESGAEVSMGTSQIRVRIKHSLPADSKVVVETEQALSVASLTENGMTELLAQASVLYRLVPKYTLTVENSQNGTAVLSQFLFASGEAIPAEIYPNGEYRLEQITLTNPSTGEVLTFTDVKDLVMPAFSATLSVTFTPVLYKIEFVYHGGMETLYYRLGETVQIPSIPLSYEEDGMYYTFIGWSTPVTIVAGDTVYTATYHSVKADEVDLRDGSQGNVWKALILKVALPALAAVIAVGGLITVITVYCVKNAKRKKKRKARQAMNGKDDHGKTV